MLILLILVIFIIAALVCGFLGLAVWRHEDKKDGKSLWKSFWDFYNYFNQAHPLMAPVFNFVVFLPLAAVITLIIVIVHGGF